MLRAAALSLVLAAVCGFSFACAEDGPVDDCPELVTLNECVSAIKATTFGEVTLCCGGYRNSVGMGATCDAIGELDQCALDLCAADDPCSPSPMCSAFYDHLHNNVAGCSPPPPCILGGALDYCEGDQLVCVDGRCITQ